MSQFSISLLVEHAITEYIDTIAKLRIDIFKEFPYLYDGDLHYEQNYLKKFSHAKDAIAVILKADDEVVGVVTGLPLRYEEDAMQRPWKETNFNIDTIYYFSEILLYADYRNQGLGKELLNTAQEWIESARKYNFFTLATVDRDRSLAPDGYQPSNNFWIDHGYNKLNDIVSHISWRDIHKDQEDAKPMLFWIKKIQYG
jgi:GNAT superfamily N-acetyltransferase